MAQSNSGTKKIFVTGVNGRIGNNIVRDLLISHSAIALRVASPNWG